MDGEELGSMSAEADGVVRSGRAAGSSSSY